MIDSVQLVLLLVIVVVTIIIVVLAVQVYLVLREFRGTIQKANKVLEHTSEITESVRTPLSTLSSLGNTVKMGSVLAAIRIVKKTLLSDKDHKDKKNKE